MGQSAALLAGLWGAAFANAKIASCPSLGAFDKAYAIRNYPAPSYLPENTQGFDSDADSSAEGSDK